MSSVSNNRCPFIHTDNHYCPVPGMNCFTGALYSGRETIAERGFKIGDAVWVGADYSEREGIIVGLSDYSPDKAEVKLTHKNGGSTTCWIKSQFLAKKIETIS